MRSRAVMCVVSAVALVSAACSTGGGGTGGGDGSDGRCDAADPALVDQVMAGARQDFRPELPDGRPGVQIDHLEARDSSVGRLPAEDRKYGAERLLALQISVVLGGDDASDGIPGFQGPVFFALDGDGELLGPAGQFTASQFDLASPADPGWLAWGDEVETSSVANSLAGCVDPS